MFEQQQVEPQPASTFVERLANQIGITANAKCIYGEPVERDGITVIPVAKAAYAFGGGSGRKENETGSGGGGGVRLKPVGYIEIKDGETRFRRIVGFASLVPLFIIGSMSLLTILWGVSKLRQTPERRTQ